MASVVFVRLRSGMYVTKDAQFRIVRREHIYRTIKLWFVEQWSPADRAYVLRGMFPRLKSARAAVAAAMLPVVEEA